MFAEDLRVIRSSRLRALRRERAATVRHIISRVRQSCMFRMQGYSFEDKKKANDEVYHKDSVHVPVTALQEEDPRTSIAARHSALNPQGTILQKSLTRVCPIPPLSLWISRIFTKLSGII